MTHPITGETIEECANRFRRIQASEPGGIGNPLHAAGHLALNDVTEEKRAFYAAVADYLGGSAMTPPNAPTAAERAGEEHLVLEIRRDNDGRLRDVQRFLRKEPETVAIAMAREASEDCRTLLARLDAAQSALLAARREHETALLHLRTLAAHARGEPTDAIALNKAMRAAAHGEDR